MKIIIMLITSVVLILNFVLIANRCLYSIQRNRITFGYLMKESGFINEIIHNI